MSRILIPADLSEASVNTITYGLQLAHAYGQEVTLMHIVDLYKYAAGTSESEIYTELSARKDVSMILKNAEAAVEKMLHDIRQQATFPVNPKVNIRSGKLLNEIQKEIDEGDVFCLLMSVSEIRKKQSITHLNYSLLNKVNCPVLLIPHDAVFTPLRKILYASSLVRIDLTAIQRVVNYAEKNNAEITVAHIFEEVSNFNDECRLRGFKSLLQEQTNYPIHISSFVEEDVIKGIAGIARKSQSDLLVLLKRRQKILRSIINKSNTERLAFALNIPMLFYPESYLK